MHFGDFCQDVYKRQTFSFVFGAAIKKIRFTFSPSKESKSTPSGTTIAASPGLDTDLLGRVKIGKALR